MGLFFRIALFLFFFSFTGQAGSGVGAVRPFPDEKNGKLLPLKETKPGWKKTEIELKQNLEQENSRLNTDFPQN